MILRVLLAFSFTSSTLNQLYGFFYLLFSTYNFLGHNVFIVDNGLLQTMAPV